MLEVQSLMKELAPLNHSYYLVPLNSILSIAKPVSPK